MPKAESKIEQDTPKKQYEFDYVKFYFLSNFSKVLTEYNFE